MKIIEYKPTNYPSDLTDSQWKEIENFFPMGNKSGYHKRSLVEAVLYLVDNGCKWRALPHDFPPYGTVWSFYRRAKQLGLWDEIMKHIVTLTRINANRSENPSYGLIDSQSVKTIYASENRGFDGRKNERHKGHIITDTMGNLMSIHVHAANKHDTKGGVHTFEKALYRYLSIQAGCDDQGYRGTFKNTFEKFHYFSSCYIIKCQEFQVKNHILYK